MQSLSTVPVDSGDLADGKVPPDSVSELSPKEIEEALDIDTFKPLGKLPDFTKVELAFKEKSFGELIRSYVVLRVCGIQTIVANAETLLGLSRQILGDRITAFFIKHTFFAQFCAAENHEGLLPKIQSLESLGVSGILDYAAEADLDTTVREDHESEAVARIYDYEGEKKCDAMAMVFEECIRTAHSVAQHNASGNHPFAAIKVTALGNPQLLRRMSEMIKETRRLFSRMEAQLDRPACGSFTLPEWRQAFNEYFDTTLDPKSVDEVFWLGIGCTEEEYPRDDEPRLDFVDWCRAGNIEVISRLVGSCRTHGPLFKSTLTREELELSEALFARLDRICEFAEVHGVRLMIDAEQTYFQPCIDANVLRLQRKFNSKGRPTIFGTYQSYLKNSTQRLKEDLERSKREGWTFAAKLVRGAYMVSERALAEEEGRPSPIHDTLEATHAAYNNNVDILLRDATAEVLVATHNQESCEIAAKRMKEYKIEPASGKVYFAQLLGMSDNITFTLGICGYNSFKYLPYGSIYEVLPYLIRRAQENSSLMAEATHELDVLTSEMKRRIF